MSGSVRPMRPADLPFAEDLVRQAGWNQTPADWQNFLAAAEVEVFVAEGIRGCAGTISIVHFGRQLSWIGMLLVDPSFRKQGIGTLLLDHALSVCKEHGSACVGLDATPAGRPLYEKKGFSLSATLERWSGRAPFFADRLPRIAEHDWKDIARFDAERFGADRLFWLRCLERMGPTALLRRNGLVTGFGMARPGIRAWYLGPIVAVSELAASKVAESLLADLHPHKIIWDCQSASSQLPRGLGLKAERPLYRMLLLGTDAVNTSRDIFAISDPAMG